MQVLFSVLTAIVSVLFSVSAFFAPLTNQTITNKDPENCKLTFTAISDTHITGPERENDFMLRQANLEKGFRDMSVEDVNAIVVCGDIADHGEPDQYACFYDAARKAINGPTLISVVGNHDTWTYETRDLDEGYTNAFISAYNEYLTEQDRPTIDKPYYSIKVKGYTFIMLSSNEDHTYATIYPEQIEWLDNELAIATADGLPVFVCCHWPINGTNGQDKYWPEGGMGDESDQVEAVLNKYQNVFYISGHVHAGLRGSFIEKLNGAQTIQKQGNVWYINLPSYTYFNAEGLLEGNLGYLPSGYGYVVEVYDNCVTFRARNFSLSHWFPIYDRTIELVTAE